MIRMAILTTLHIFIVYVVYVLSRFTQKNILRVFPKGTRVTSTNFRPLEAWMHGAQMVAFNMQVRFEVEWNLFHILLD